MHAQSEFSLKKCAMAAMVPACGINWFSLGLMLVISDIEDNLDERDKRIGLWSLWHYTFFSVGRSKCFRFPLGLWHWPAYFSQIRNGMDHCHCHHCCVLCELGGLRKGLCQCERDVAEALSPTGHCNKQGGRSLRRKTWRPTVLEMNSYWKQGNTFSA